MLAYLSEPQADPILSIMSQFQQDPREDKLDLGIGVYKNSFGITPIMDSVKQAQIYLAEHQNTKSYVGLAGNEAFNEAILDLLFNQTNARSRSTIIQTPGASGALRMLADLIYIAKPSSTVWISDPSYVNHKPVMEAAGLNVKFYSYFDVYTRKFDIVSMFDALSKIGPDDIVLIHACCHNPTGADLTKDDWQQLLKLAQTNGFTPFVDLAYQGFGDGITEDLFGVRLLANQLDEVLITYSCSKSFGLYRERTGAAIVVGKSLSLANKAKANLFKLSRASYTMPPDHGAAIVAMILKNESLYESWCAELNAMRERLVNLRCKLSFELNSKFNNDSYSFFTHHKGMFSMTGFDNKTVNALRDEYGIYLVGDGRINIAGFTDSSINYFVNALYDVMSK